MWLKCRDVRAGSLAPPAASAASPQFPSSSEDPADFDTPLTTETTTTTMEMPTTTADINNDSNGSASSVVLQGRVFDRRREFEGLEATQQQIVQDCCEVLTDKKEEVFQTHHSSLIKSVLGVRYKTLYDFVDSWLKMQYTEEEQQGLTEDEFAQRVKKVVEGLVLCGYLTPCKESASPRKRAKSNELVQENELLIPVKKSVADFKSTSVWDVVEGAVFAAWMKRKHGLLAPFTQGKDVYVVVNEKSECVHLFESDVARGPLAEIQLSTLHVCHDTSHFELGLKLFNEEMTELFNTTSKQLQDALMTALLGTGARYREVGDVDDSKVSSFYDLKDYGLDGKEVLMDQYRGRVLLVVNVARESAYTEENCKQLVELDNKYRSRGLAILAFPCNQFKEEPGSNVSIANFVNQFGCKFDFFEKGDVNGPNARPVYVYLKKELPGLLGSSVKWNFTKFLVDHTGKPVQRYSPKDLPLTFEDTIQKLLAAANGEEEEEEDTSEQQPEHDETKLMSKQDKESGHVSDEDNQAITEGMAQTKISASPGGEKTDETRVPAHHGPHEHSTIKAMVSEVDNQDEVHDNPAQALTTQP